MLVKALEHQYHDLLTISPSSSQRKILCHLVALPDRSRYFDMAKPNIVKGGQQKTDAVPTILHFSSMRVHQNNAQEQRNSFMQALQLQYQTVHVNHNTTTEVAVRIEDKSRYLVSRNNTLIPWDTIVTPMSTYGRKKASNNR
jgi:hypothetical protein